MSEATTTTDHDEIRRWAEERGGRPSVVRTEQGRGGILRFDFGEDDEKLEETSWEEFFRIFEDSKLALLRQDTLEGGETSRFFKFVVRDAASGARRPRKASLKQGTSSRRAPAKAAKRSTSRGASKRASSAASKGSARPKRASKAAAGAARGGTKASARRGSKTGTKAAARKSGPAATKGGAAAKKSGTASRKSRSAASSAGLKGATKRTRSGGRASKKPSR